MQGFLTMLKLNLKMLLRNKGYLISVIGIPLLSLTWIWFVQYSNDVANMVTEESHITELNWGDKALQQEDKQELAVKVYDASKSKAGDYFLQILTEYSMYNFYRVDARDRSMEEVKEDAKETASHSNLFTSLYLPEDFEEKVLNGQSDKAMTLFLTSEDGRGKLLQMNCNQLLTVFAGYGDASGQDKEAFYDLLSQTENSMIGKEVKNVSPIDVNMLTEEQKRTKTTFGYVLAFFSLSFLLSGVFISGIYVNEKNNNVLKRITLTKANFTNYIAVKLVLAVITLLIEEIVILAGIGILGDSVGLSPLEFVINTSGVGIILLLLAIVVGTYTDNIVTVAFGGFFAWTISNCMAGLYFPIADTSMWQAIAKLMPQYWSMHQYETVVSGAGDGVLAYIVVTMTFLVFLGSMGVLGLKLTSKK